MFVAMWEPGSQAARWPVTLFGGPRPMTQTVAVSGERSCITLPVADWAAQTEALEAACPVGAAHQLVQANRCPASICGELVASNVRASTKLACAQTASQQCCWERLAKCLVESTAAGELPARPATADFANECCNLRLTRGEGRPGTSRRVGSHWKKWRGASRPPAHPSSRRGAARPSSRRRLGELLL